MSANVPVTTWKPADGNSELAPTAVSAIVDTTGVALVDTVAVAVVDTGSTQTPIPTTVWAEDDSE